ncbi:hypothetical protein PENSPDRAFT_665431 [Peniophora sp. CONT]|nr:hypothetical protein PENSPDRAFT_665431 [Peniophora sp. CONT]
MEFIKTDGVRASTEELFRTCDDPDELNRNQRTQHLAKDGSELPRNARPELPEPQNRAIELRLDQELGRGKAGFVHSVETVGDNLPSLCVKIAFPAQRAKLSTEAWYYDDLQLLQGSAIPLCYGYFEAELSRDSKLLLPDHAKRFCRARPGDDPTTSRRIGLLLLERLSDEHLPLRKHFSQQERHEIHFLLCELSRKYVHYSDLRWSNVLRVVPSSQPTPEKPLPATKQITPWRLVDLEGCQKHLMPFHYHTDKICKTKLDSMLDPLEVGEILNPEDY